MKKYILLLTLLSVGIFSLHAQELVSIAPRSITVPQQGGTFDLRVDYAPSPDSLFDWRMSRYSAPYSDIQVSDNGNKTVRVTFPANTGYTPRSGNITLYYPDPTNYYGNQVWGSCSFSQQGLTPDYSIKISPTYVNPPAEGGYSSLQVSYINRTGAVTTTYQGATGLPDGCTLSNGGNGALTLYCPPNKTGAVRYGSVTVRYSNPLNAAQPETATFSLNQQPIPSWISLSPKTLSVPGTGGTEYCTVAYSNPDTLFSVDYKSFSGGAGQVSSVRGFGSNQIQFTFNKNQGTTTVNSQITVYVTDPINSSRQLSDVISFSQPPVGYDVQIPQNSVSIPSGGGSHNFQATYVHRDGPVALTYQSCSGLPAGCTVTPGSNGLLTLNCGANQTTSTRNATVTVYYTNPLNASQPVSASFSFSQPTNNYAVTIPQGSLNVAPGGGTSTLGVKYQYRTEPVSLTIHHTDGLPANCTLTHNGSGTLTASFDANLATSARSGTATVYFNNPANASQPVSASFSYSQNPVDFAVTIPSTTYSVNAEGGSASIRLSYANRQGDVTLDYLGAVGLPAGCTLTQSSNKAYLTLECNPNRTGSNRYANVTVRLSNPLNANVPVTATFSMSQEPERSWISLSPKTLSVPGTGGTEYCTVAYSNPDTLFNIDYKSFSGGAGQVSSAQGFGSNQIQFTFKKNQNTTTVNSQITVYVTDPINSSRQLSDVISFSQPPVGYDVQIPQNSASIPSGGGSHNFQATYVHRDGPVALTYQNCSGLPAGCTLTPGSNGLLTLNCNVNQTNSTRNATVTVYYTNPLNASQPVSASFSFSQLSNNYAVTIPQGSLSIAPGGGASTFSVGYQYRTDPVSLTIDHVDGLPENCTLTHNGSGTLTATFDSNLAMAARSGTATVYFNNPANASQPLSASFSYSQNPVDFAVTIPSTTYTVNAEGGSASIHLSYTNRPGDVTLDYLGSTGLPDGCTLAQSSNKAYLTLECTPNRTGSNRYANVTVQLSNPLNANVPVTATFTMSQEPQRSWIVVTPKQATVAAKGGDHYFDLAYSDPDTLVTFECTSFQATGNSVKTADVFSGNRLKVTFNPNYGTSLRTNSATFYFKDPANSSNTLSDAVSFTQEPVEYTIQIAQNNVTIPSEGGSQSLSVTYVDRIGQTVDIAYRNCTGLPEGCSLSSGQNGQLTLNCGANQTTSVRTVTATVYFENPLNASQPVSAAFTFTQQPNNYAIRIPGNSLTVAAAGGTYDVGVAYSYRTDAMSLTYRGASGLPEGATVTKKSDGVYTVTFPSNQGTSTLTAEATLSFDNPADASQPVTAAFTFAQQPVDFTLTATPQYVTLDAGGGSKSVSLAYQNRDGNVALEYLNTSGLPTGCSASYSNSSLIITGTPNYRGPDRYGEATASFTNPLDAAHPVTVAFHVSQPTYAGYWIEITTDRFTVDADGGSYEYDFAFGPTDSITVMPTPRLGTPVNTQVDQANFRPATTNGARGVIVFKPNTTGSTINGTVVLEYPDPTDHSRMLTHAISFSQASALPVPQQQSTTERVYTDEMGHAYNTTVTYYDGLYRQEQTVQVGASPAGGDVVSFVEYDCMGRADSVSYLPFATSVSSGAKVANPVSEQTAFYSAQFGAGQGEYARSHKVYDRSPLGLVLNQTSPGENYTLSGYYSRFEYRLNTQVDSIRRYRMEGDSSFRFDGYYAAERLTVKRVLAAKDNATEAEQAQQKESYEYTNAQGQVIAKEVRGSDGKRRMTYYVYDDLGQQRYVLPPAQHEKLKNGSTYRPSQVHLLSYYTEYNDQGQAVRQWNPGTDCVYSLYDLRGRLALSQSGKQRENNKNEWSFTKYDEMDRPVLSGIVTGGTYESHQAALNAATVLYEERGAAVHGYTNQSYPLVTAESDYLTVTYYDDYDWLPANDPHAFSTADALGNTANYRIQGQTTGGKSKVLGIDTDEWLTTAAYFDSDYQAIQSVGDLYPSGAEITSNTHDFTGNVTQTKVKQIVNNTVYEYNKWFEFDNFGRLQQVSQQITGDEVNGKVILASYTYDELGHTATKSIHNGLETESYDYDLQGRTIQSLSPSFSWWLGFDQTVAKMTGRYDGNIQAAVWQHAGETKKAYRYTYDGWGQMTSGIYRSMDNGSSWSVKTSFKENVGYEKNSSGNINWISHTDASGVSTSITLGFTGYQVKDCQLSGQSRTTFIYDTEGNLIYDGRSGVDIEYNCLNLPEKVSKDSHNIHYIYNASGQKLACDANGSLTYYRSVMVYGHDNKLLYMLHPEGTVSRTEGSAGTSYTYNYFKTDHLGSTRVMLTAVDGVLQASQTTDYYPFGLSFENNNLNKNKYLFSGKELQDGQLGGSILGWYDFGARFYDPILGRWFNVDPAGQYTNPYLFCGNSPIMYIDKDGRLAWFIPIIIGAFIGGVANVAVHWNDLGGFWGALGYFGAGAAVGAVAGLAAAGMASVVGGAFAVQAGFGYGLAVGASGGAVGGYIGGAGNAWINGASFSDGLKAGAAGAGVGALTGGIIGGVSAGISAAQNGRDFWNGAKLPPSKVQPGTYSAAELDKSLQQINKELQERAVTQQRLRDVKLLDYKPTGLQDNALVKYYPENNGFVGTSKTNYLLPGDQIHRYGDNTGRFYAPVGTPDAMRSLPYGTDVSKSTTYQVLKPFPVQTGTSSQWFNQIGYGTQYQAPLPVDPLLKHEIIVPVK